MVGLPTGRPESGCIANIVVFYVLEKILLPHPKISPLNHTSSRKRFLDDLWFGWFGSVRQFSLFRSALNKVGGDIGITFKGNVGKKIDFLNVTVELANGKFITCLFLKPTDAPDIYIVEVTMHLTHSRASLLSSVEL